MMRPLIACIYFTSFRSFEAHSGHILNLASALRERVPTVLLAGFASRARIQDALEHYAVQTDLPVVRAPIPFSKRTMFLERVLRGFFGCAALVWIHIRQPRIIFTSDIGFLYFLSFVPGFFKPRQPVLFEQHKIYHRSSSKMSFAQEQRALAQALHIFAASEGILQDLARLFGIAPQHMTLFRPRVNGQVFAPARAERAALERRFGIRAHERLVIYSGSFLQHRGVEVLVEAAAFVTAPHAVILLLGGVGEQRRAIEQLAQRARTNCRVIVAGQLPQHEAAAIVAASNIGIVPMYASAETEHYSSPMKVFEYMASGIPMVCSDVPSLRAVLEQGRECLFFAPGDARALAAAIDRLLGDDAARVRIGEHNVQAAKAYSYASGAARLLARAKELALW